MQPYNYQVDVQNPVENALRTYAQVNAIKQQKLQNDKLKQEMQQQEVLKSDLNNYYSLKNPSLEDARTLLRKQPQIASSFKMEWEQLNDAQKKSTLDETNKVFYALKNNNVNAAKEILERKRDAALNSEDQREADLAEANLKMLEADPKALEKSYQLGLIETMGPDQFKLLYPDLEKSNKDILEEEKLKLQNEKLGYDLSEDKLGNERVVKQTVKDVSNIKDLIDDILSKENRDALKAAIGKSSLAGSISGTKARTMKGKIERLKNIIAKSNLPFIKGALSEGELEFVKQIDANLDRGQEESEFINELLRLDKDMVERISGIGETYGVEVPEYELNENEEYEVIAGFPVKGSKESLLLSPETEEYLKKYGL